jgi:hypothetical protein
VYCLLTCTLRTQCMNILIDIASPLESGTSDMQFQQISLVYPLWVFHNFILPLFPLHLPHLAQIFYLPHQVKFNIFIQGDSEKGTHNAGMMIDCLYNCFFLNPPVFGNDFTFVFLDGAQLLSVWYSMLHT